MDEPETFKMACSKQAVHLARKKILNKIINIRKALQCANKVLYKFHPRTFWCHPIV